ncbi:MAG: peptidase U32 family protein [Nanobdellota archaeon]
MKIIAPASCIEEIEKYSELGVDEIYLGYKSKKTSKWDTANKRNEEGANFTSLEKLSKVKELCPDTEISLTLNASFFHEKNLEDIKEQIKEIKPYFDNLIIADASLINLIKKLAPEKGIILSCIAACLNTEAVKFYQKQGVRKIILPRHLTLDEFKDLSSKNPTMSFEVMILNQFCRNIDGFCSRCHIPSKGHELATCDLPSNYEINLTDENLIQKETQIKKNLQKLSGFDPKCGVCFIPFFKKIGIDGLKIVGRSNGINKKVKDVIFLKKVLENLDSKQYTEYCKNIFEKTYEKKCNEDCYY